MHTCGLLQPSVFRCDWESLTLTFCSAAVFTRTLNIVNYFCSWVESSSWLRLLSFLATSLLRMYLDYSEVSRLLGPLLKKGFCFLPVQSATDALGSTFDKQESNLKNIFEVCSLVHSKQRKKRQFPYEIEIGFPFTNILLCKSWIQQIAAANLSEWLQKKSLGGVTQKWVEYMDFILRNESPLCEDLSEYNWKDF